ncbi:hypothetical protein [Methylobacterium sp. J-067]|uniref:hypothetical protein n=1 Tax=Methylobacterium sp. J-067 TaxID=2836648 RepID=UPI0028BE724D|nr:hypothetical protein [Methylobacterium sp. J-067]
MIGGFREYGVSAAARQPLIDFMLTALEGAGCTILFKSDASKAPFVITFETSAGERMGVVAYAFRAKRTPTRNRPVDERSFQLKYGSLEEYRDANTHTLWQDPTGLYTTLLVGIDPEEGFFVGVDPEMHNPTKFFIRLEFKDRHAEEIKARSWFAWERDHRGAKALEQPAEVLVGGTGESFLRYVQFERAAQGLDQGNRQLLAERPERFSAPISTGEETEAREAATVAEHPLLRELELTSDEVLEVIAGAKRLKMAVRGWVAEDHLRRTLMKVEGVTECERLEGDGNPDIRLRYRDRLPLLIECKNVLRVRNKAGEPRVDFQRTRASKSDPCSRYYAPTEFNVVAACLHAVTEAWEFRYALTTALPQHQRCVGKIASNVAVGEGWSSNPAAVFEAVHGTAG